MPVEPVAESDELPECLGELRAERGVVERLRGDEMGETAKQVGDVSGEGGIERLGGLERGKEASPLLDGDREQRGRLEVVEPGKQRVGVGVVGGVRVGVGDARRQIVRLVDDEQRVARIETGLVEKKSPVVGCKHVVEVADPDVVKREAGAGDLVGADERVATGVAQGGEIARLVVVEIKLGEPALRPALGGTGEVAARVAHAVESGVDAVLGFVAHLPERWRIAGRHALQRLHDLQLAGGFSGEPDEARKLTGPQAAKRKFHHAAGLAVAGGRFEKENG